MYSTFTDKKASIVERVQRTIRNRIFRLFTIQNDHKWYDNLPNIVESYNNSINSTIKKMRPNDVKPEHTAAILKRLYFDEKDLKIERKEKYRKRLLKVGDQVRIAKDKKFYPKEADKRWSEELYTIRKVEQRNFPITYKLTDDSGTDLPRSFYREDLQKSS